MLETRSIQAILKRMGEVYRETSGGIYDAFSIRFFNDGSGSVMDGLGEEVFDFSDLNEFILNADQWILDQYPDSTTPDVYDGMHNDDIEVDLATEIYAMLTHTFAEPPSALPFPEMNVDLEASSVVIHLAGRKATIFVSVEDDDGE